MTTNTLTIADITTLVEALEAWETKDLAGEIMSVTLTAMLIPPGPEREQAKRDHERQREDELVKRKWRKEQSVILQGKLLHLRDSIFADQLIASTK
jgi:hypothetical protein